MKTKNRDKGKKEILSPRETKGTRSEHVEDGYSTNLRDLTRRRLPKEKEEPLFAGGKSSTGGGQLQTSRKGIGTGGSRGIPRRQEVRLLADDGARCRMRWVRPKKGNPKGF